MLAQAVLLLAGCIHCKRSHITYVSSSHRQFEPATVPCGPNNIETDPTSLSSTDPSVAGALTFGGCATGVELLGLDSNLACQCMPGLLGQCLCGPSSFLFLFES